MVGIQAKTSRLTCVSTILQLRRRYGMRTLNNIEVWCKEVLRSRNILGPKKVGGFQPRFIHCPWVPMCFTRLDRDKPKSYRGLSTPWFCVTRIIGEARVRRPIPLDCTWGRPRLLPLPPGGDQEMRIYLFIQVVPGSPGLISLFWYRKLESLSR